MKLTQHEIIIRSLADQPGVWIPSHQLVKQNTPYGYIGSQGGRRARELAEDGKYEIGMKVYYVERRQVGKYAEYRVAFTDDKPKMEGEIVMKDGRPVYVVTKNV